MEQYMTRKDEGIGEGLFDSIAWALEVHVKQPDTHVYQTAILHGNEDYPLSIVFFTQSEPTVFDVPAYVWHPKTETAS